MDTASHVVIVGGGFGGLAAARALGRTSARITLIDRTNHHLFQPLLYQVATCVLSAVEIAAPLRHLLRRQKNTAVEMTEVLGVDPRARVVSVAQPGRGARSVPYDYLVLATGASGSYFGHDEWAKLAPYPKTIADVLTMRDRILKMFELAELQDDPAQHRDLLTFVLVGAGPTGVEMAGALATMTRATLKSEFRRMDPASARVILMDAGPRILAAYSDTLADRTHRYLTRMGVEIRTGARVEHVDEDGVVVNGERVGSRCVFWTAGVHASPAGTWLGAETDHAGRVRVLPNLTVPGHPEIFVVGDAASIPHDGRPLPGLAQVAIQSGHYAGHTIRRALARESGLPPFRYLDKGSLATVSPTFAIFEKGRWRLSGWPAKGVWAFIHILYLSGFENRFLVLLSVDVGDPEPAGWRPRDRGSELRAPGAGGRTIESRVRTRRVGMSETPSIFAPVSTPAFAIREIAFFVLGITAVIFIVVAGLAIYALVRFRRRRGDDGREPPQVYGSHQIELAWTVVPLLIVVVLFLVTARYIYRIEWRPQPDDAPEVTIVGHQWWWEIRYPKLGIVTANELHVPVSDPADPTPTFITLQSADVIHSFWIPQLAGKMDVIPNKTNRVWIEPQRPGTYVGQCAEYCGVQHAGMLLTVTVHAKDDFARWATAQRAPGARRSWVRSGRELFSSLACINCHTVRGTTGQRRVRARPDPPDEPATIGAGVIRNTPETLRAWVDDPASLKPGALMPAMKLSRRGPGPGDRLPPHAALMRHAAMSVLSRHDGVRARRGGATTAAGGAPRLGGHRRPQAARHHVRGDRARLPGRGRPRGVRDAVAARVPRAARRAAGDVQPALHDARHDHGVPGRHPDRVRLRQLPGAADDRRPRPRLSAPERVRLLDPPVRRAAAPLQLHRRRRPLRRRLRPRRRLVRLLPAHLAGLHPRQRHRLLEPRDPGRAGSGPSRPRSTWSRRFSPCAVRG